MSEQQSTTVDCGPLRLYRIVLKDGTNVYAPAHKVTMPDSVSGIIVGTLGKRLMCHAQLDGKWTLTYAALTTEVASISLVIAGEIARAQDALLAAAGLEPAVADDDDAADAGRWVDAHEDAEPAKTIPVIDAYTGIARLCDDDGVVRGGSMHAGTDYRCTGSAHPRPGQHICCTNPRHYVSGVVGGVPLECLGLVVGGRNTAAGGPAPLATGGIVAGLRSTLIDVTDSTAEGAVLTARCGSCRGRGPGPSKIVHRDGCPIRFTP